MRRADQIWNSLEDEDYRREFNVDVDTGLAFQIRALREKNGWTQQQLGEHAGGKKQEVISQWENPNYGRYSLKSLKSLATAFDVGLMVRFVPFSDLVNWNANLTPERIAPPSFAEERQARQVRTSLLLSAETPGPPVTVITPNTLSMALYGAEGTTWLSGIAEPGICQTIFKEVGAYAHRQAISNKELTYELAA